MEALICTILGTLLIVYLYRDTVNNIKKKYDLDKED